MGETEIRTDIQLDSIIKRIKNNDPTLTDVSIYYNLPHHKVEEFSKALKVNKTLKSMSFYGPSIGGVEGARCIAEALKVNTTLESITLFDAGLGDEGVRHIAEALKENTTLKSIVLREEKLGEGGARCIAEALKVNKTLKSMRFYGPSIGGDEGVRHIAEALKVNKSLQRITLDPIVREEGVRHIAEALKVNKTLQEIGLLRLEMGAEGVRHIAEALKVNKAIRKIKGLHISSVGGDEGARHIAEALKVNEAIQEIDLQGSDIVIELIRNRKLNELRDAKNNGVTSGDAFYSSFARDLAFTNSKGFPLPQEALREILTYTSKTDKICFLDTEDSNKTEFCQAIRDRRVKDIDRMVRDGADLNWIVERFDNPKQVFLDLNIMGCSQRTLRKLNDFYKDLARDGSMSRFRNYQVTETDMEELYSWVRTHHKEIQELQHETRAEQYEINYDALPPENWVIAKKIGDFLNQDRENMPWYERLGQFILDIFYKIKSAEHNDRVRYAVEGLRKAIRVQHRENIEQQEVEEGEVNQQTIEVLRGIKSLVQGHSTAGSTVVPSRANKNSSGHSL